MPEMPLLLIRRLYNFAIRRLYNCMIVTALTRSMGDRISSTEQSHAERVRTVTLQEKDIPVLPGSQESGMMRVETRAQYDEMGSVFLKAVEAEHVGRWTSKSGRGY